MKIGGEGSEGNRTLTDPLGHVWTHNGDTWTATVGTENVSVIDHEREVRGIQTGDMARLHLDSQAFREGRSEER